MVDSLDTVSWQLENRGGPGGGNWQNNSEEFGSKDKCVELLDSDDRINILIDYGS